MANFSDQIKFNIPSLKYAQEQVSPVRKVVDQRGARQQDILKGFLGVIPKLQKAKVKLETDEAKKQLKEGYIARQKQLGVEFKKLRKDKSIGLIDDPFFQRGLAIAEGQLQSQLFSNQIKAFYEAASSKPTFFEDPSSFEKAMKVQFDLAYASLPQNIDSQEGFLGKISPLIEGVKQKYKQDSTKYYSKKNIEIQQSKTGASFLGYNQNLELVNNLPDGDVLDYAQNVPDASALTATEARAFFKTSILEELVSDLDEIGDNLNNFLQDPETIGLGSDVEAVDLQLDFILKQVEDPFLGVKVLNKLKSGTGKLSDTDKGKAALNVLWSKAQKASDEEYEKNHAFEYGNLISKISNFDIYLSDNTLNLDQGKEQLEKEIDSLYPANKYPEENAKLQSALSNDIAQFKRSGGLSKTAIKNTQVLQSFNTKFSPISTSFTPLNVTQTSQAAIELDKLITQSSSFAKGLINTEIKDTHEDFLNDPDDHANSFWNLMGVVDKYNKEQGGNLKPLNSYSSKAILNNDPKKLQILYEAEQKGILDSFVDEDSIIGTAIKKTGEAISDDPAIYTRTFKEEVHRLEEKEELEEIEDIYDVDFDRIPINMKSSDNISFSESIPEFVGNSNELDGVYPNAMSRIVSHAYLKRFSDNFESMSKEAAIDEAITYTSDRFKVEILSTFDDGSLWSDDKVLFISDTEDDDFISYLDDVSKNSEDSKQQGISQFVNSLRHRGNPEETFYGTYSKLLNEEKNRLKDTLPARIDEAKNSYIKMLTDDDLESGAFKKYIQSYDFEYLVKYANKEILYYMGHDEWETDPKFIDEAKNSYIKYIQSPEFENLVKLANKEKLDEMGIQGVTDPKTDPDWKNSYIKYIQSPEFENLVKLANKEKLDEMGIQGVTGPILNFDHIENYTKGSVELILNTIYDDLDLGFTTPEFEKEWKDKMTAFLGRENQYWHTSHYFKVHGQDFHNVLEVSENQKLDKIFDSTDLREKIGYSTQFLNYKKEQIDADFSFDNEVIISPIGNNIYTLVDDKNRVLKYEDSSRGTVLFTKEDIGNFVKGSRYASSQYLWPDIKHILGSTNSGVTTVEMEQELNNYFTNNFPKNPTTKDFEDTFGGNSILIQQYWGKYSRGIK